MALLTSLELDSIFSGHVIASFIVAPKPIDVAVRGHLWQLAFRSSFSSAFLCCVFSVFFNFFLFLLLSVSLSAVIDILFLFYFQGDVGPPGPPGPVSTI